MAAAWLLAAAISASGQTPSLTDQSLDRLVSLPATATLSTGSFRHLHGFKDTDHLAPVLLPSESRYKVLQSAEEVREAMALDPVLSALNPALAEALRTELASLESGRELLEGLGSELPPILFTESADLLGSYRSALDAIALNWKDARAVFDEAAELDCADFQRFLAEDPARSRKLVEEFAPVLGHELVHARQKRLFGFDPKKLPNGGRYLEMETEAYFFEARLLVDWLEAPGAGSAVDLHETYVEALLHFIPSLDHYLDAIEDSYVRIRRQVIPIKDAVRRQRRVVARSPDGPARDAARAALAQLENAAEFYIRHRKRMADLWPNASVRASLELAQRRATIDPSLAMSLAVHAASLANEHGFDARRADISFATAAREKWRKLEAAGAANQIVRRRYVLSIEENCRAAGLECSQVLAELGPGMEAPGGTPRKFRPR